MFQALVCMKIYFGYYKLRYIVNKYINILSTKKLTKYFLCKNQNFMRCRNNEASFQEYPESRLCIIYINLGCSSLTLSRKGQ